MRWLIPLVELAGVTRYTGGVGRRYAAVLPEIVAHGSAVTIVLYPDSPVLPDHSLPPGVEVVIDHRFRRLPAFLRPCFRAVLFARRVSEDDPDVVFAPEWLGLAGLVRRRTPVVTNLVTGIELMAEIEAGAGARKPSLRRWLQRWLQGTLEAHQITRSTRTIAISTAIGDWYRARRLLPPDSVVVRNCIDVDRVRRLVRASDLPSGWPHGSPVLLHAGRVEVRKGAHTSIRAFNILGKENPHLTLVLAGGRGYALPEWGDSGIESLIDPAVRSQVIFLGDVPSGPLYRAMAEAVVCMAPSLWEAFGNIALEVKACGTPLVVTSGSGFDDFCEEGVDSRVVAPDDAVGLARAVRELLGDEERRDRIARVAAARVEDFTASVVARDLQREVER